MVDVHSPSVNALPGCCRRKVEDNLANQFSGRGVRIALLDTGLAWSHMAFSGAQVIARDFSGSGTLNDRSGHGTVNAALLVGRCITGPWPLVPDSEIFFAKVSFSSDRQRTVRSIEGALRWCINRQVHIVIMPFGCKRGSRCIARVIDHAQANGITVFAAAGNSGANRLCFPACMPSVIAVSALAENGDVLTGCCAATEVNLFYPAQNIAVPALGAEITVSGSSVATVIAAGVQARHWSAAEVVCGSSVRQPVKQGR